MRLPFGRRSLRRAGWVGLQDSMPRAAVLSVNARMERTTPSVWEDPAFVQVWGPRYSSYVIPQQDRAVFTLGRLPDSKRGQERAYDLAARLEAFLEGRAVPIGEAGRALGGHPSHLRYAATTGSVVIRWDGARQPTVWTVAPPEVDPVDARKELARRYLHIFGPSTPEGFAGWAGVRLSAAIAAFDSLRRTLIATETPIGSSWLLKRDVDTMLEDSNSEGVARLLPSGDAYYLLQGNERSLLVADATREQLLWTSRVWPGAILVNGEIVGTWRRAKDTLTATAWTRLPTRTRNDIEAEAASLPLPDTSDIVVRWA